MRRSLLVLAMLTIAAASEGQQKSVGIQYMPGLSNAKKLADPFSATYSTLYLLHGGGGHVLMFESDFGVVLINTMGPGWGKAITDSLDLITQEPVTTIINTHPDPEYTGGNPEFPGAATIVAHANATAMMKGLPAFQGEHAKALPNKTYTDQLSLLDQKNRIELFHFGPAHTNADTVVVIPRYSTAYLGDLFPSKSVPVIDAAHGGSARAFADTLQRALESLVKFDVDYVVAGRTQALPGMKQVRLMSVKDVREYVDFVRFLVTSASAAREAGKNADEAAATLKLPDAFAKYDTTHLRSFMQAAYTELAKP